MIHLQYLLQATHGTLVYPGKQHHFDAFSHDTRQLLPGELFVAVRGEHSDGHDYVLDAVQRGAAGIVLETTAFESLDENSKAVFAQAGVTIVAVDDTRIALQQYAHDILARWHPTVIAVTGSTGKTTTKEAIAAVLSSNFATFRSWQNYNDLLGLPLSLGRLEERHEFAVLELSCDHPGEIRDLCQIIQPQIGVLTNISPTQLQYFGTVERLADELGTLLAYLPAAGKAFVNGDDERIRPLTSQCKAAITYFSPSATQDVQVDWTGLRCILPATHEPVHNEQEIQLSSHLLGQQYVTTLLAAYYVGKHCGLQTVDIQHALAHFQPLPGRLNPLAGVDGATLLDDTHNAAPAAVLAGLATLKALPAARRIAILGDMTRLGNYTEEAHRMVGQQAATCVDYLILRGEHAAIVAEAARQAGLSAQQIILTSAHEDAAKAAGEILGEAGSPRPRPAPRVPVKGTLGGGGEMSPDVVLIKGAEGARMERVTELLMAQPAQAPGQLVRQTPGWKQIVMTRAERPTWIEIDLSAIANNTRQVQALVGPQVRILASLKADAYGHGAVKVARTVLHNGASMVGVATVSEATPLRDAGIQAPILVFGYVPLWQMREAVRLGLTITLYSLEAATALSRAALALGQSVNVHVKIDTGMGRLGVRAEQIDEVVTLVREILALPGLRLEGIFTHFAMADTHDLTHAHMQLARFQAVLQTLETQGLRPPLVHAASSAPMLSVPEARFDMVRPGIALYGLEPSDEVRLPAGFRAALSFKTQVAQVKIIPTGEGISYGCTYITEEPTRIAVLPVGYADGFRRGPTNWDNVLLHGQEAPILGRVCMDQCMVNISHIPQTRVGDEVVLIGQQGMATLSAEQVAQRLGTSNYEVVSAILARVPRVD
ncbi:MAG TPA: alanine racemase [Ktedonobacteraceae bacterium]|nr:alanine racemase [Ktedonobacteraceae bacterium]